MNNEQLSTPYYIVYEDKLRHNLEIINDIKVKAGVNIIMALKANALWKTFPIIKEYVDSCTASSLNELQLGHDYLGGEIHSYCPVYPPEDFNEFLDYSSHITFNSIAQFKKFENVINSYNSTHSQKRVSCGLRVNPEYSLIETDIYNPCRPGSRFGVTAKDLPPSLPVGIEGLHFHALCEGDSHELEQLLVIFREKFGQWLPQVKWINMGGGHLMTRKDYDRDHLIKVLKNFKEDYPHLEIILEPGSAFTWQTGDLITTVLDIVDNQGIKTAVIDSSFACHMPDCLEMPYKPKILESSEDSSENLYEYVLGGNSCLSGDFIASWKFNKLLEPGQRLTFLDMNHYTTVKTHMFNGIKHPSIYLQKSNGDIILLRNFSYEDYRDRMD